MYVSCKIHFNPRMCWKVKTTINILFWNHEAESVQLKWTLFNYFLLTTLWKTYFFSSPGETSPCLWSRAKIKDVYRSVPQRILSFTKKSPYLTFFLATGTLFSKTLFSAPWPLDEVEKADGCNPGFRPSYWVVYYASCVFFGLRIF